MNKHNKTLNTALHIFFIVLCIICVFPVLLTLSISLTDEASLIEHGYRIIPKVFSLEAYKYVFSSTKVILRAYATTIGVTVIGTLIGVFITAMFAYVISRPDFKYRNALSFFSFFTMLFSGGLAASYMMNTSVLHLTNKYTALILVGSVNAWNIMIMKSFYNTMVPHSIVESGKLDGANEFRIFFNLVMPIVIPGVMTVALNIVLSRWNDWQTPMLYITDKEKYTLAFLMQNMLTNVEEITAAAQRGISLDNMAEVPQEGAKMALCLVAAGPILVTYPFFQKYFVKGMTIGSVKG